VLSILLMASLSLVLIYDRRHNGNNFISMCENDNKVSAKNIRLLVEQRNNVSRILNAVLKELNALKCSVTNDVHKIPIIKRFIK